MTNSLSNPELHIYCTVVDRPLGQALWATYKSFEELAPAVQYLNRMEQIYGTSFTYWWRP